VSFGPITIRCAWRPCPARKHFEWTTPISANRAARASGWQIEQGVARCPFHIDKARPRGHAPRAFDDATEKRITDLYAGGLTTTTLGVRFGVSHTCIRRIVLRNGGTMRAQGTRDGA
jgi:hypothetical protein